MTEFLAFLVFALGAGLIGSQHSINRLRDELRAERLRRRELENIVNLYEEVI